MLPTSFIPLLDRGSFVSPACELRDNLVTVAAMVGTGECFCLRSGKGRGRRVKGTLGRPSCMAGKEAVPLTPLQEKVSLGWPLWRKSLGQGGTRRTPRGIKRLGKRPRNPGIACQGGCSHIPVPTNTTTPAKPRFTGEVVLLPPRHTHTHAHTRARFSALTQRCTTEGASFRPLLLPWGGWGSGP